jgi:hypothetical protein
MGFKVYWIGPAFLLGLGVTLPASNPAVDANISPYMWAGGCKECHQEIYSAWAKTKHKVALFRLGGEQRRDKCGGCHMTGFGEVISSGAVVLNGGVQCEACHGPALAHAIAATEEFPITEGLTRPKESVCVKCHCEESPHFQWFDYKTLSQFVHPLDKP